MEATTGQVPVVGDARERRGVDVGVIAVGGRRVAEPQGAPGVRVEAFFDGACEPQNPGGHGVAAIVVRVDGITVHEHGAYLGHGAGMSNNVAEYRAVAAALEWIRDAGLVRAASSIVISGDSMLAIRQLSGAWAVRGGLYVPLYERARTLLDEIRDRRAGFVELRWIRRDENALADSICRRVLHARGVQCAMRRAS